MNDRFKFRVWSKKYNKFIEDTRYPIGSDYQLIITQSGTLIKLGLGDFEDDCEDSYSWATFDDYEQDCIVMQCTGLKDKNGKLIYEGDIVDKGTRCKWIITWFKNRFILVPDFEYKNKDKCASDRECGFKYFENNHSYADKDIEVIGNIYENKDLLNA